MEKASMELKLGGRNFGKTVCSKGYMEPEYQVVILKKE